MKKIRNTTLASLILLLPLTALAQQGLLQSWRDALASDPTYAAARYQLDAAQEKVPQARASAWLPSINGNANLTYNDSASRSGSVSTDSERTSSGYGLTLTQPLWRPQALEGLEQSKLGVVVAETQFNSSRQDLALRLAQAYFDVLVAQDALEVIRAQKKAVIEQLASAKRNFEVGTSTITDTNEAQARYDLVLAQEIAAENDLEIKRTGLQQITGKLPLNLLPLRSDVTLPAPVPTQQNEWVTSAETNNYAVRIAQTNAEIAQRETSKAKAGHLPSLDLVASHNQTRKPQAGIDRSTNNTVGVQLTVPIFAGFATQARVRETLALEQQASQSLEAARRTAAQSARQSFSGVTSGLAQVKALEAAELSSQTSLDSTLLGYRVGVRVNVDVLNAQQQLFQTRRDLSKARYDTLLAGLRLKAASGTLEEADLQAIDALLLR
jgi:outer membrane protein